MTSFFAQNYARVQLPVSDGASPGLRRAQRGALHAVASHFTLRDEPALVSMPTGSGKTAVLMLAAFYAHARRVLVVTPSRLVRGQIAEDFSVLRTLTDIGAYPGDAPRPRVKEVDSRITSDAEWDSLRDFDVAVAIPSSSSPALEGVPPPSADLFDLLLVDEAHHSPAATWAELLRSFPDGRKVLFTATPFRRDRREIPGRFIFSFPLKEAYKDGIFGRIRYVPVHPADGETSDAAIARKAEATFRTDQGAGLKHLVMVRTDRKSRAAELKEVYGKHTSLRLQTVHSGHSLQHVKSVIRKLRDGELDGIICVDMLGEGFDLPNLKIAAIHAPHKSLEVTLQFIGRFARTGGAEIGEAKFLAVPAEIEIETERLYDEGKVWQEIIAGLSESRISREEAAREAFESFEPPAVVDFATEDLSLYALTPYCHVKVFHAVDPVDIHSDVELPEPFEVVFRQVSSDLSAVVLIARELRKPRWTDLDGLYTTAYELFLVYYDKPSKLLFINSSKRNEGLYEEIAYQFSEVFHPLPLSQVDRVLRGLDNAQFFNIGMKNRVLNSKTESYRIIAGTQAEKAVARTDGRLYHRGHIFGRGEEGLRTVTIGYSSLSKVWSNQYLALPEAIAWCRGVATKIADASPVVTGSALDHLSVGREIDALPAGVIAADWDYDVYRSPPLVRFVDIDGRDRECQLLDFDLVIDRGDCTVDEIAFSLAGERVQIVVRFRLGDPPRFRVVGNDRNLRVCRGHVVTPLERFLNAVPVHFYFADLSRLQGNELFAAEHDGLEPFPPDGIVVVDWAAANVNIEKEFWQPHETRDGRASIHDHLEAKLNDPSYDVVLYDHRSGEIADFIAVAAGHDAVTVRLFHCKGSGGPTPGNRIDDVYEVCGQAVKCAVWLEDPRGLTKKVRDRVRTGSQFLRGDILTFEAALLSNDRAFRYEIVVVQPGITRAGLAGSGSRVLAAAGDYLRRARSDDFFVWASA